MSLQFYFDYLSPYAYLAWRRIHAIASDHGRAVEPVPVLFAALLSAHGQKGPAEIASKRIYTFKHVLRIAADLGITITPPPAHPFNPLLALRVSGLPMPEDRRRAVIDALYEATWGGGPGVGSAADVQRVLDAAGFSGAELVAQAESPSAKARLRAATDSAIARGVFGVPTIIVQGELFWGQDSLPHLHRFLRAPADDPARDEIVQRWRNLPAAAHRVPR